MNELGIFPHVGVAWWTDDSKVREIQSRGPVAIRVCDYCIENTV